MADNQNVNYSQQYEPLPVPSDWSGLRRLVMRLTEILDDVYRRYGRLRMEDMSKAFQKRIEDDEGNIAEIAETAKGIVLRVQDAEGALAELILDTSGLVAAVENNRLSFTASGLEIRNAAGVTVFKQDNATGNLIITGAVVADSGRIGGFTIGKGSLSNGTDIVLDAANGLVQLGGLTITDKTIGPVLESTTGLAIRIAGALYMAFGNGLVQANYPLYAQYGLFINPSETTTMAPNLYVDPMTGKIYRSTAAGGTGGVLSASLSLSSYSVTPGTQVTVTCSPGGGTPAYAYTFTVSRDGGSYTAVSGSGASRSYTPPTDGTYRFRVLVSDAASNTCEAFADLSVGAGGPELAAYITASHTDCAVGTTVTWTVHISGGSGSYGGYIQIYTPDNADVLYPAPPFTATKKLNSAGPFYAFFEVSDQVTGDYVNGDGGYVSVGGAQYGYTTGTSVIIRSGPGTGYSEVARIPNSGTQVTITGSQTGGWWPVYWNGYNGYISGAWLSV